MGIEQRDKRRLRQTSAHGYDARNGVTEFGITMNWGCEWFSPDILVVYAWGLLGVRVSLPFDQGPRDVCSSSGMTYENSQLSNVLHTQARQQPYTTRQPNQHEIAPSLFLAGGESKDTMVHYPQNNSTVAKTPPVTARLLRFAYRYFQHRQERQHTNSSS